jgi:predicted AAA+ superfamily ATPase
VDANETAVELLKLIAEDYSLDDVIEDYKKVMATIKGEVVVKSESVVLGKTGGRNVPIVKQADIKSRLTDSIAATAGSAVTSNLAQF